MFDMDQKTQMLVGLTAAVGMKFAAAWWLRQRRNDRFERVGTVSDIVVYPIKSCQGIPVQEAEVTKYGMKIDGVTDRHWMLTRHNGLFLSGRMAPKMVFISMKVIGEDLQLHAPGMQPLFLKKPSVSEKSKAKQCIIGEVPVEGIDCGDEAANWVADYLQMPNLRVVHYFHDLGKRKFSTEPKPWDTQAVEGDLTGYADWCTFMFMTRSSVAELNKHLERKVTFRSFRPNIMVEGTDPFDEDNWEEVRIGNKVQMRCLDACTRCILTTVDPDKGIRHEDGEPLKTLKRIRSIPPYGKHNLPAFGIDAAPDVFGMIKVGDPVYAIRYKGNN